MNTPKDKNLYESVKKEIYLKYPKHSAYRSGLIVKNYKEKYLKKYAKASDKRKSNDAYSGNKNNQGLSRWFAEEWKNQRGEIGYKKKGDVYRPTIKVNNKTPKTFSELSQSQIKKAMAEKKKTGRVKQF